ncbi:MAG: TrkA family potassium uptake protein [Cytophagales bacterium]
MASQKFAVIGLGIFGTSIAKTLAARGAEVLAVDFDHDKVESLKDDVAHAVTMDSTDLKSLMSQNVQDMDAVVVAIGENFEGLLMTTVLLLELKVKRVIARAANAQQYAILQKVGVQEILSPEGEVGKTVAEMLLQPTMKSFLQLPDEYEIVEIKTPKKVVNKTLGHLGLRENYHLNLITVKRTFEEKVKGKFQEVQHIVGVPHGETLLYDTDILIIMGKHKDIARFVEINT